MEFLTIIKIQITTLPSRGDKYYHCIALSQFAYMRKNITPHRFVHAIENCDEDFIGYIINNIKKTRLKTYLHYRNYKAFKSAVENGSLKVVKLLLDEAEEAGLTEKILRAGIDGDYGCFRSAAQDGCLKIVELI